jgi:hypothetical protein
MDLWDLRLCAAVVLLTVSSPSSAAGFVFGETEGLVDLTLSYGALYRLDDADRDLVAIASGGRARSSDTDDGNLNYKKGLASNMVRVSGELAMIRNAWGFYARGSAFYDYENEHNDRARTDLTGSQKKLVGSDAELTEVYLSLSLAPGGMPLVFRGGRQVVSWSETTFLRDGLALINPVNAVTAFQPASDLDDLRVPQGMVWGAAGLTEIFSVEAYYQYEWEPLVLPPVGTLFSNLDLVGGEGLGSATFGAGEISDLGTNLDDRFMLPEDTLGFDSNFQRMPGIHRVTPDDDGQYGVAVTAILPGRNAIKGGFHYIRYHSRLPIVSGRTGDLATVAATSNAAVDARAAPLAAIYEDQGFSGVEAALLARDAAEQLTLSGYANDVSYFAVYPEDIDAFGFSFNTATMRTGSLFSGEITYHKDFPFQIAITPVLDAIFDPVLFDPEIGDTVLGDFGPSEIVSGVTHLDRTQATLEVAQIFRGRLYADQVLVKVDLGWTHVDDMPGAGEAPLTSSDENSWGYRVLVAAQYTGVGGGVNLSPRIGFTHDVDGSTPAPLATFVEDRKSLVLGLSGSYINRISADLSYVSFFHGGRRNTLRDRDYVRFQVTYSF